MVRYRRKDTGEIVEVVSFSNYGELTKYYDKDGNLHETNLNLYKSFEEIPEIDWEQRRYEIAKEAMNGLLAAPVVEGIDPNPPMDDIARNAVKIADYLIEELKKGANK